MLLPRRPNFRVFFHVGRGELQGEERERARLPDSQKKLFAAIRTWRVLRTFISSINNMLGDNQGEGEGTRRRRMGRGLWGSGRRCLEGSYMNEVLNQFWDWN